MSYSYYERDRQRRRRQAVWRVAKIFLQLGVVAAVGLFAYQFRIEQTVQREKSLQGEIEGLAHDKAELEQRNLSLQSMIANARLRTEEVERRLQQDAPTGPLRDLMLLARKRLEEGVAPQRLEFVISNASNTRDCTPADGKRFMIRTPLTQGANTAVTFEDGKITVTGSGKPDHGDDDKTEAWFDPDQPVTVYFTVIGGTQSTAEGMLPLHHSLVINNKEYRYTLTEGAKGFVNIASDTCSYP